MRIARGHQLSGRVAEEDLIRAADFCPALFPGARRGGACGGAALGALRTMATPHAMMKAGLEAARSHNPVAAAGSDDEDGGGGGKVPPRPAGWEPPVRKAAAVIAAGGRKHARDRAIVSERKRMRGGRGKFF